MRTARRACVALVTSAVLAAPVATAAQSSDAETAPAPAYSTGTETFTGQWGVPGATFERFPWGIRNSVGFSVQVEGTDPRADGDLDIVFTYDQARDSKIGRGTGVARLVNDDGSWLGPISVIYYPDGSEFRYAVMEGEGDYKGLTLSMTSSFDEGESSRPRTIIWASDAPPVPDAELLPD